MVRSIWSIVPAPRSGETRDRLIDAAACLFYEHGFHAVGLDRVLADVGVTKTTFYNHFESKDALIVAILRDRDERDVRSLVEEMRRAGGTARDKILLVFDVLDAWLREPEFKGCLYINAMMQFPSPSDPVHVAARTHGENLERVLREQAAAGGAGDAEALARQLGMVIAAAILARQSTGSVTAASDAREMAAALLDRELAG